MKAESMIGVVLLVLVVGGLGSLVLFTEPEEKDLSEFAENAQPYVEIEGPTGFVNTGGSPITLADYAGKNVILVDFLTYSCINCQRTFPYLNTWYETYKDDGLVIVGIHTPEFAFEKDINNVEDAMEEFGIEYPIVLDNDYATWRAYGNRYWPRKYLIDIHGNIVYDHIGEGAYDETEMKIQELLAERAEVLGLTVSDHTGTLSSDRVVAERTTARSPETYFGAHRNEYLANGESGKKGTLTFETPTLIMGNMLYLGGTWNIAEEYAESVEESVITYRYNAKEVYLVADADDPVEMEIYQDGEKIGEFGGADVDENGIVTVQESRLYKLTANDEPGEHTLEIRIKGEGLRAYAFTFG